MPSDELHISEATPGDALAIRQLQQHVWLHTYPGEDIGITAQDILARDLTGAKKVARLENKLSESETTGLALRSSESLVGVVIVDTATNKLDMLYVHPDFQGIGLGARLMNAAISMLDNEEPIELDVATCNYRAIDFYRSHGFVETKDNTPKPLIFPGSKKQMSKVSMIRGKEGR